MKQTYSNCDKLKLNCRGRLVDRKYGTSYYDVIESCAVCGEPFLGIISRPNKSIVCSPSCQISLRNMAQGNSDQETKELLAKEGYILNKIKYLKRKSGNKIKRLKRIYFTCPKGHKHDMYWGNWLKGRRCKTCGIKKYSDTQRTDIEDLRKSFELEGYILLNKEYTNCNQKLYYICPNGHKAHTTVRDWNQGKRCAQCYHIKNSGPNHPNWQGGIAAEPYCQIWLDKDYKESIKERDNYECQNQHCYQTSNKLVVHHIDYNKKNCIPNNLITLCNACNAGANANREWWQSYYQEINRRRLNYDR